MNNILYPVTHSTCFAHQTRHPTKIASVLGNGWALSCFTH